ncbi:hypothetical protein [uncultured Draconibacterium sp.]|uniref:hypothetical protein n=1 Tax=uncultured Draconibacterium sp. TaxID=1573823 RepID=UPI0025F121F4|nr:hypothetical protein [uncultured Draconibacterium sp.]
MENNQIIEKQNVTNANMISELKTQMIQIEKDKNAGTIDHVTAVARMKALQLKVNKLLFTEDNEQLLNQFGLTLGKNIA